MDLLMAKFGPRHASVADIRFERALLFSAWGKTEAAVQDAREALSIYQHLPGPWEMERAYAMSALGFALHRAGQLDKAAQSFENALALMTQKRGELSLDLPPGLMELGEIYLKQRRFEAAETNLKRAILIQEQNEAATPRQLVKSLNLLARLYEDTKHFDMALGASRRTTRILNKRTVNTDLSLSTSSFKEQLHARDIYTRHINLLYQLYSLNYEDSLLEESFIVAQQAQVSQISQAVTHMAERFATGSDALAEQVRERQDLEKEWHQLDGRLMQELSIVSSH